MTGAAVDVRDLTICDTTGRAVVAGVSFQVAAGGTLGIVGESGSGKTTLALAVLGIVRPGLHRTAGQVLVDGRSVSTADARTLQHLRRRVISYLGQDPATSLEPTMRIHSIVSEVIAARRSGGRSRGRSTDQAVPDRLRAVGLPGDDEFCRRYPHQLSGGQQQRVALARSLASDPSILILDEPTTGLDVVIQELILTELATQRHRLGFTTLVISHDLAVVARLADSVIVMQTASAVDAGSVVDLFSRPTNAYTATLVEACPDPSSLPARRPAVSPGVGTEPRLEVVDLVAGYQSRRTLRAYDPPIPIPSVSSWRSRE